MSITGNLRTLEFSELLQWLAQGQKTGALVIVNGGKEKRVFFKEGRIISSESNIPDEHLGTFMVREGLLDEETLARAIKLQESTQILLGKVNPKSHIVLDIFDGQIVFREPINEETIMSL